MGQPRDRTPMPVRIRPAAFNAPRGEKGRAMANDTMVGKSFMREDVPVGLVAQARFLRDAMRDALAEARSVMELAGGVLEEPGPSDCASPTRKGGFGEVNDVLTAVLGDLAALRQALNTHEQTLLQELPDARGPKPA